MTLIWSDGYGRSLKVIGPIDDLEEAGTLKVALDRLEKILAKQWLPPRPKPTKRGRTRKRPGKSAYVGSPDPVGERDPGPFGFADEQDESP